MDLCCARRVLLLRASSSPPSTLWSLWIHPCRLQNPCWECKNPAWPEGFVTLDLPYEDFPADASLCWGFLKISWDQTSLNLPGSWLVYPCARGSGRMEALCSESAVAGGLLPSREGHGLQGHFGLLRIYFLFISSLQGFSFPVVRQVLLPALMQPSQGGNLHSQVGNVGVGGTGSLETLPVPWGTFIIHGI